MTYPSIRQPPAVSAAAAESVDLTDGDEVVGVVVDGKARAYPLRSMGGAPQNHVVNDLVAGRPLTVTYCDLGKCIRVFTHSGSEPLDVHVAGLRNDDMMLNVGGRLYSQASGESLDPGMSGRFPFEAAPFELTTWIKWRQAHPDTDVSVGARPGPHAH